MKIKVISDIHVAKVWDKIEEHVDYDHYLNPNHYLREVVANSEGENLLIFNGDMIDYYYADYHAGDESNWAVFFDILHEFEGDFFCNLGNHEYRSHPYNFDIYGLQHVNIPAEVQENFSDQIGHNKFRWLSELNSIMMNGVETLEEYPYDSKYYRQVDDCELLFLDTGHDAFADWKNYLKLPLWPDLLSPDIPSQGLNDEQINFLKKRLRDSDKQDFIIFLHNPPFYSYGKPDEVKLTEENYVKIASATGPSLGFNYRGFIDNNWELIKTLRASDKNILVITGHSHAPGQFVIDKEDNTIRGADMEEINELRHDEDYVKFISNLPLGAVNDHNKKIGHLEIGSDNISYVIVEEYS